MPWYQQFPFGRLVEGYMPIQMLLEMGAYALIFIVGFYLLDKKMGIKVNKLLQATLLFVFAWMYFTYRVYPPIPFSVRAIYATMTLIGIFMWISSTEEAWQDFRRPIIAVTDATSGFPWVLKILMVIALPILVGVMGFRSLAPSTEEPIALRTVHPAPPASTKVHGKTFVLQTASSPFRVDDDGKYSDMVQNKYQDGNPWDEKAPPYLQHVREGGQIFFQNCHFCHGDNLNGRGMFAFAFDPIPANFTDAGTIAQLQETFVFWRVAKGGIGLPREAFPWASVMPQWEQHLTTDEIWKVILFEYWHTGYYPRTWD